MFYSTIRKQRLTDFMEGFSIITSKLKEMYQMITLGKREMPLVARSSVVILCDD